MHGTMLKMIEELIRESFEGARPGQGTYYLDHASGVHPTLRNLTAAQASHSRNGHPSIAAHARHMAFHMRVSAEWLQGVRDPRDWPGSFKPFEVNETQWNEIRQDLETQREKLLEVLRGLDATSFAEEGAGMGALAHIAYHLGAIRQLRHEV